MLLRLYRLTDRLGLVLLKLSSEIGHQLFGTLAVILALLGQGGSGVLKLLRLLFGGIAALLLLILGLIGRGLQAIQRGINWLFSRIFRVAGRGVVVTAKTASKAVSTNTQQVMARRAARAEMDVTITEDPLKAQNRRLSVLVVILGLVMVGAILWATDPARTAPSPLVAPSNLLIRDETPQPTPESALAVLATPIPVATQAPIALQEGGTLAYTIRERGQTDLWLVGVGSQNAVRITNDGSDERDPAWSADGSRLAYASRRDGNWDLYVFDLNAPLETANTRVTFDLSFQANPSWSPDGLFLVYESYQGNNLDIYAVPIDGSEPALRLTDSATPDFAPAWSPNGRQIAFVSWRDGNQDIHILNLDTLEVANVTQTPLRNENDPAWSPDGRSLLFSAWEGGREKVFVRTLNDNRESVVNFGRTPSWSPSGSNVVFAVDSDDALQTYLYAIPYGAGANLASQVVNVPVGASSPVWSEQAIPPRLVNGGGLPLVVAELYNEQFDLSDTGAPYRLRPLVNVTAPLAVLSDRVNDSFAGLRERIASEAGVDFLATLDDAWWDLERRPSPGEERRSWLMTGRAFAFSRSAILGFPPTIELVREEIGVNTYWRAYLRVDEGAQSGQLGEPLRTMPWDFLAATSGDVEAFNNGGRLRAEVPSGYYIDVTQLALDYGWLRVPSGTDWRSNVTSRNYWLYYKTDGLDWFSAMLEIYNEGEIANFSQGS